MPDAVQTGMLQRLLNALPTNWFPKGTADQNGRVYRIYAQMAGTSAVYSQVYAQLLFLRAQSRIQTQTGGFLDLSSRGFFGTALPRKSGESDQNYSARIIANFFKPQGTYEAMIEALTELTGNVPTIIRPRRPADVGAYGSLTLARNPCLLAYSGAGAYGSLRMPYQAGISIAAPASGGIPGALGYGSVVAQTAVENYGGGGYGQGGVAYRSLSDMTGGVTIDDIYQTIKATKIEGTIVWAQITAPTIVSPTVVVSNPSIDDFTTDFTNDFI